MPYVNCVNVLRCYSEMLLRFMLLGWDIHRDAKYPEEVANPLPPTGFCEIK